ncbi:MAG: heavy-metal-associated domain-containing protein [Ruminococcus sp.]|jgi:Copper chaperone|nr:heavy-metal-associated domain-containing protein [Ruminococcus sp.]
MIKTTLKVEGMMCGMCESHVNDEVRKNFAVSKVSSSHKNGTTEIISDEQLDEAKLREVIEATGYKVLSSTSEPYEKKGFSLFGKK